MTKMPYSTESIEVLNSKLHESSEVGCQTHTAIPTTTIDSVQIEMADVLTRYSSWKPPTVIVSDGAYGLGLFPGDPPTPSDLVNWYKPHIAAWSHYALPETTLWFWCSEIGWANIHPILIQSGWQYRSVNIWDKGLAHIAGNVNSKTIRRFPIVTEVCVHYIRNVQLPTGDNQCLPMQQWLRHEWLRSGLPLSKTNEACGVKNAATRKYFTQDHLWYFPPPEMMESIVTYANFHGKPTEWPYFSIDGKSPVTAAQWSKMRSKWYHIHGVTNVWSEPALRGTERVKNSQSKSIHANQKPLRLIERIILASSDINDVIWEPFGGMCSVAVASLRKNRCCYSAEINPDYYYMAKVRLEKEYELLKSFLFPEFL